MALTYKDTTGQWWQIIVNPDGSLSQVQTTSGFPTNPGDEATVQLQNTVNLCRTHLDLMPIADVGGFTGEPALSLCNDTLQELCAQPFNWKFNSRESGLLITQAARQEYIFAGASAFTKQYGVGIDLSINSAISESGNTVTVNTLQPHNFSVGDTVYMTGNDVAAYNSTFSQGPIASGWSGGWTITATPTPTSFQFTHATSGLAVSGAPGIYDFAWLETGVMVDTQSVEAAPREWPLDAVRSLKLTGTAGRPRKIAVKKSAGGILTVRLDVTPMSSVWAITLVYQAKPPQKVALTDTWSPFPDQFGFVYRQMFLARCYRYLNHNRADAEEARALAMIQKALARDDSESNEQYVSPQSSLMGGDGW